MKIVLFGGSGQVGKEIVKRNTPIAELFSPAQSEVSVSDAAAIEAYVASLSPDIIINSAAYTAVDKAETEQERAYEINALGPKYIAQAAKKSGAFLVHISTDYVYPGSGSSPVTEHDDVAPINVYGSTKLEGENFIRSFLPQRAAILRTASVHGAQGQNFVHTMLSLFSSKDSIDVVSDQSMSPTWAGWLAESALMVAAAPQAGTFNCASRAGTTWFEFATAIEEASRSKRGKACVVNKTTSEKFKRPAPRPMYSVLDCSYFEKTFDVVCPTWQQGLAKHLAEIL